MANYWLHRVSYEWNASSYLLNKKYLSIGWSHLYNTGIENKVTDCHCTEDFEKIMRAEGRQRWGLFRFLCFREGDIVVVPLYGGEFSVYKVKGNPLCITSLPKEVQVNDAPFEINDQNLLIDKKTNKQIDLGFVIPVEPLKQNLLRSKYADAALTSRMKIQCTNADIGDLARSVDNVISAEAPINLYSALINELAEKLLETLSKQLNPDKFEKLIKWYFQKIGATTVYIPAKNESGKADGADADIIANFDPLKTTFFVQAKYHRGESSEWAVEQISKYKEHFNSEENTAIFWVITTAKSFSSKAVEMAGEEHVRLITGEEFAQMLLDAGITDINSAFE